MTEVNATTGADAIRARVVQVLPNEMFLVELPHGGTARVHAAGQMRVQMTRLMPGHEVDVELSRFDPSKGRIVGLEKQT